MQIDSSDMTPKMTHVDNWLNLSMLRLLSGVAEHGSLSASAQAAGVAQSNASRSIKTLERRLGYSLLYRSPRGSTLTQEGKLTVEWAREVLQAVDRLTIGAETLVHSGHEELTIGASMTIAEHLLPGWIGAFRKKYPEVTTKLRVMNSADVIGSVETGEVCLGFVETPVLPTYLNSVPVWTDQLFAVVGVDHPWAQRKHLLELEEIAVTPLIEREKGSGTRAFLDVLVGAERPEPLLELNSISAICQAVIEGIGPAILSKLALDSYLRTGQLVQVPTREKALDRVLHSVWKENVDLTESSRRFLEIAGMALRAQSSTTSTPSPHLDVILG